MKYSDINIKTLQEREIIFLTENFIRGGISNVMGFRYVKSDQNKKILYIDANNLYVSAQSQRLPYDETKFVKNVNL